MAPATGTRVEVDFPATQAGFARAFDELRARLDGTALAPAARYRVELVFEEIVANIIRHGGSPAVPSVAVTVETDVDPLVMTIADDGPAFDPSGRPDPALPASLEDAPIGGLGLLLVRRMVRGMEYRRTPADRNCLSVSIPTGA